VAVERLNYRRRENRNRSVNRISKDLLTLDALLSPWSAMPSREDLRQERAECVFSVN
jgi:hypothetical protein